MVNTPPLPGGELPILPNPLPVEVGFETRVDLTLKLNEERRKKDEPELPVPTPDTVVSEAPLRVEIEALLDRVLPAPTLRERNNLRRAEVRKYLEQNYPKNQRLRDTIMSDLESYPQWEEEVAEGRTSSVLDDRGGTGQLSRI